jgi:hypothetical protein
MSAMAVSISARMVSLRSINQGVFDGLIGGKNQEALS